MHCPLCPARVLRLTVQAWRDALDFGCAEPRGDNRGEGESNERYAHPQNGALNKVSKFCANYYSSHCQDDMKWLSISRRCLRRTNLTPTVDPTITVKAALFAVTVSVRRGDSERGVPPLSWTSSGCVAMAIFVERRKGR